MGGWVWVCVRAHICVCAYTCMYVCVIPVYDQCVFCFSITYMYNHIQNSVLNGIMAKGIPGVKEFHPANVCAYLDVSAI